METWEIQQYEPSLDWWSKLPKKASIKGTEKVGGRMCYVVQEKGDDGTTKIWIDKSIYLPVIVENTDGEHKTTVKFFDFKDAPGGGKIPMRIELYENNNLLAKYLIKEIKYNTGISDGLFNPDNVKTSSMEEMMKHMMKSE